MGIYWLEIVNATKNMKHLTNHYILKVNKSYMVFTRSAEIPGVKCTKITDYSIVGETTQQYIAEKVHCFIPKTHIIKLTQNCVDYLNANQIKLQPFIEKMQQIS